METIEELKQQNDILNARLEKAKQVFKEMKEKENSLNAHIEELEKAAEMRGADIPEGTRSNVSNVDVEWKAKAEELIVNNDLLSDELNSAQVKIEALQERLNSAETEKEKALSATENVINELNAATKRLEQAQNELAQSQEAIDDYKADLAEASEKIMLQDNVIGTLQMQLDEATAELKALMARHTLSSDDATLLFTRTAELRETYARGVTNIDAIDAAIRSLVDTDANGVIDGPEMHETQKTYDAQVKKQTATAQATQKTGSLPGLNDFNINI